VTTKPVRTVSRVDVYRGQHLAGELVRTAHGAIFSYAPTYITQHTDLPVAFSMPVQSAPYEIFGNNLHPFFAGLLPEGLRLRALVREIKTSEDDLFSLLVASGADTVGDVAIAESGVLPTERAAIVDLKRLSTLSFRELLEQSLRYESGRGDVTVAGVQPKISAAMISFPLRSKQRGKLHILKLSPPEYPRLVENEAFFMRAAKSAGLHAAVARVITDRTGESALLVERFDRIASASAGVALARVHQEDACQLLDRYPADKYRLSLGEIAEALDICSAPLAERLKLLRMQALSYLIINGDMHAKNLSIRVIDARVELTPCYDLLSTLPYGDRKLALSMEGRDDSLQRSHFVAFGERHGLRRPAIEQMLDKLIKRMSPRLHELADIGLERKQASHLERVMRERMTQLSS
jgi:serine/threonine-protein kinase HipA